ncbi:MAG: hypothetical protein B7Z75_07155 [Acidocella sp. 20-57-95]|nr:MAG: hypothetical protein B7Z75_07155 [Acidocella sp. 20-57-95]OYV56023.1 MAG: hypothetical protein B7Z71_12975 [Acidocella sp. 21-58-7]HQT63547.1 flagellar biosynthesis anti-sigma factor FlgM [Acidocella sp.]
MSNIINTGLAQQTIADASLNTPPVRNATNASPLTNSASTSEAVTVSADAQITTNFLNAARLSDGINHTQVTQLRSAIQNGSYQVTPENLASAISASLKGRTA